MITLRPADANEVTESYRAIMELKDRPACLILSRQPLPTLDRARYASAAGVRRGAYILADAENGEPDVLLIGTGSEVALCIKAYEQLKAEGTAARVVSMPSWELFEQQDRAYQDHVLPPGVAARVSVEQPVLGWDRYVGRKALRSACAVRRPRRSRICSRNSASRRRTCPARHGNNGRLGRAGPEELMIGVVGLGRMGGNIVPPL